MTPAESGQATPPPRIAGSYGPFVGRQRELGRLEQVLGEAASGAGRVVLLSGEPGMGKTRLATELARRAEEAGWLTLAGHAYETSSMPPYLPFREAIGQYIRVHPPPGDVGPIAGLLAPGNEPRPGAGPVQSDRYSLFESAADLLIGAARSHPPGLLLRLEDIHWADPDSLHLLQHLARRLPEAPLLLVATCRNLGADRTGAFTGTLATLIRERLCEQVDLAGLTAEETGALIGGMAGVQPPAHVAESLQVRTAGNPFFIEEVVHDLQLAGRDISSGADWNAGAAVPGSIREVLAGRLDRLSEPALRTLQVAAALDDHFPFETLALATGAAEEVLLASIDEAVAHGLLHETGEGRFQFRHAILREAIYLGLSAPRRAAVHAGIARRLTDRFGSAATDHAGELARHLLLGGRAEDLARAAGYAIQAAERAMTQLAFADAARHYETALDALERSGERTPARRCTLLLDLAAAVARTGDMGRMEALTLASAKEAREAGLSELLIRSCLASSIFGVALPDRQMIPMVEAALEMIPAGDSARRSALLSVLACQLALTESWEEAEGPREESIAMARRLKDGQALAFALRNAYMARPHEKLEVRREHVAEVMRLARDLGDKELELTSGCDHLQDSLLLGDLAAVDSGIEEHTRLAEELQQGMQTAHALILRGMRALLAGPLPTAVEINAEMHRMRRRLSVPWADRAIGAHTFVLRWEQGRLDELEPVYEAGREPAAPVALRVSLAFVCAELGRREAALQIIRGFRPEDIAAFPDPPGRMFVAAVLAQACATAGETAHAEWLYRYMLPQAGYAVSMNGSAVCLGAASRYLGLLAAAMGDFDLASRHFDEADVLNSRLGARPLLAHTMADRARMLLARDQGGDVDAAAGLLESAARAFDEVGITFHARVARELAAGASKPAKVRATYPGGLSEREVEVLRLLAAGMTNQQIADHLVISLNTVIRHVSNIFDKTGVANRAEAATFAARNGLAGS